mmetsp:Transcript_18930/g.72226  ORF Transcript_18930/g.72226 Transcript_18930/m.72226 type:complete len:308 (+) Transcript_18930:236-1159(+)
MMRPGKRLSKRLNRCAGSMGLDNTASTPASVKAATSCARAFPVQPRMRPVKPAARMRCVASGPFILGIEKSIVMSSRPSQGTSTRSPAALAARAVDTASRPSSAGVVSTPILRRMSWSMWRLEGASSTTMQRTATGPAAAVVAAGAAGAPADGAGAVAGAALGDTDDASAAAAAGEPAAGGVPAVAGGAAAPDEPAGDVLTPAAATVSAPAVVAAAASCLASRSARRAARRFSRSARVAAAAVPTAPLRRARLAAAAAAAPAGLLRVELLPADASAGSSPRGFLPRRVCASARPAAPPVAAGAGSSA